MERSSQLPIHVIEGDGLSLLGRDWLSASSIRVTGLPPTPDVHAFRAAVPFDDFETQAFPAPVSGTEPAHQAAPTQAPPPPGAAGDANTPAVNRLAQQYECFREGLGCYTGPMSIFPDPAVRPIYES